MDGRDCIQVTDAISTTGGGTGQGARNERTSKGSEHRHLLIRPGLLAWPVDAIEKSDIKCARLSRLFGSAMVSGDRKAIGLSDRPRGKLEKGWTATIVDEIKKGLATY